MFDRIYRNIYYLGLKSGYLLRDFFRFILKKIKVPLKAVGSVLMALFLMLARVVSGAVHLVADETKDLFSDMRRVRTRIRDIWKNDRKNAPKLFFAYARQAFSRHGMVFRFAVNTALPIAAFVLLCVVIGQYSNRTLALEVTYNDSVIGYVESEAVYHEAQEQAAERLATAAKVESATVSESTGYAIKSVKRSELRDAAVLCDEIIERSNRKVTNACGIYIDDVFLCAVKNETDATAVFDNILHNYEIDDENAEVGFVENISYVQGLYPDGTETIWDASRLSEQLNSTKSAAQYYTVEAGDTISGIAQKFGLTTAKLFELNPGVSETIKLGQQLLISREVSYIQVQVTKTETRTVSVPYQTVKEETASLYSGTKRTKQKGVNGEQVVTELVTYVDGVRTSVKEVSRETTREPVDEIIQVGTKKASYGGYSGSYSTTSYGGRFIWPAVGAYSISSGFGYRSSGFHGGIDIVKPGGGSTGAPVVAAGSGTVVTAGYHSSYGYYVVINHGGGVSTLYAHMLRGSLKVSAGQTVSAGQAIGNIGSTGNVTGPHLHFEVRVNGNRVNPLPYLGR
ncbi:MAG: peptidoglycan DD-metalloendopeptidase family protein [Candidatus Fimenecus sp.]